MHDSAISVSQSAFHPFTPPPPCKLPSDYISITKQMGSLLVSTYKQINPSFLYSPQHNPRRLLTQPAELHTDTKNHPLDNIENNIILHVNDQIVGSDKTYIVLDLLGTGSFGQVVKCVEKGTNQLVALKVLKNHPIYHNQGLVEAKLLEALNTAYVHESSSFPIVKMQDQFMFQSHLCFVFELLGVSLFDLIKMNKFRGLSSTLVRIFTKQILVALEALYSLGIIHCDLKPENVLLKDGETPALKLIDFGSACLVNEKSYSYIQSRFYRSPEVLLGCPYSFPIDIWSLGCLCFELFVGMPLFPGQSQHRMLMRIQKAIGKPPVQLLVVAEHTKKYYDFVEGEWELKSDDAYAMEQDISYTIPPYRKYFNSDSIDSIIQNYVYKPGLTDTEKSAELSERMALAHMIKCMLRWDPGLRWTPSELLRHPFIQEAPLTESFLIQCSDESNRNAMSQSKSIPSFFDMKGGQSSTQLSSATSSSSLQQSQNQRSSNLNEKTIPEERSSPGKYQKRRTERMAIAPNNNQIISSNERKEEFQRPTVKRSSQKKLTNSNAFNDPPPPISRHSNNNQQNMMQQQQQVIHGSLRDSRERDGGGLTTSSSLPNLANTGKKYASSPRSISQSKQRQRGESFEIKDQSPIRSNSHTRSDSGTSPKHWRPTGSLEMKEVPTNRPSQSHQGQYQRRHSVEMRDEIRTSPRTSSSPKNPGHWQKRTSVEMTDEKVEISPRTSNYNSSPNKNNQQQQWQQKRQSVEMKEENRVSPRGNNLHWSPRESVVERFPPLGGSPKTYSVPSTSPRNTQQWQKREFNDQKPKNQRNANPNNYFPDSQQKNTEQWNPKRISVEMKDEKPEISPRLSKSFGQQQNIKQPQQVSRSVDMTDSFFSQSMMVHQFNQFHFPPPGAPNQFAPPPQSQNQSESFNSRPLFYHQQFREQNQTIPKLNFPYASFQEPLVMMNMDPIRQSWQGYTV